MSKQNSEDFQKFLRNADPTTVVYSTLYHRYSGHEDGETRHGILATSKGHIKYIKPMKSIVYTPTQHTDSIHMKQCILMGTLYCTVYSFTFDHCETSSSLPSLQS